jgi:hypothetical protein
MKPALRECGEKMGFFEKTVDKIGVSDYNIQRCDAVRSYGMAR